MIGYGLDRIEPLYPPSSERRELQPRERGPGPRLGAVSMAGFIETMSFDLVDVASLYTRFVRIPESRLEVENPRTIEHQRPEGFDTAVPDVGALPEHAGNEYPQKVFEVGTGLPEERDPSSSRSPGSRRSRRTLPARSPRRRCISRPWSRRTLGEAVRDAARAAHWAFAEGRSAEVFVKDQASDTSGEVKPSALAAFGLDVPVCRVRDRPRGCSL